jgi:cell division initiation protein
MKITPVDVAHKTFNKSVYGLDQKEVASYLQAIADQLETLIRERNDLREKLRDKEIQISEFKDRDQLLKSTLTTASQMSEKIREDAEKKAELVLQEAHLKANDIQRATHDSLRKAYQEINDLRALRIQFETNMKALAHAHLALLEEGQKYMGMPTTNAIMSPTTTTTTSTNEAVISSKLTSEISPLAADMI